MALPHPLRLHFGDIIIVDSNLILFGVGAETYEASLRYMLSKPACFGGVPTIAVVRDLFDRNPARPMYALPGTSASLLLPTPTSPHPFSGDNSILISVTLHPTCPTSYHRTTMH